MILLAHAVCVLLIVALGLGLRWLRRVVGARNRRRLVARPSAASLAPGHGALRAVAGRLEQGGEPARRFEDERHASRGAQPGPSQGHA